MIRFSDRISRQNRQLFIRFQVLLLDDLPQLFDFLSHIISKRLRVSKHGSTHITDGCPERARDILALPLLQHQPPRCPLRVMYRELRLGRSRSQRKPPHNPILLRPIPLIHPNHPNARRLLPARLTRLALPRLIARRRMLHRLQLHLAAQLLHDALQPPQPLQQLGLALAERLSALARPPWGPPRRWEHALCLRLGAVGAWLLLVAFDFPPPARHAGARIEARGRSGGLPVGGALGIRGRVGGEGAAAAAGGGKGRGGGRL